MQHDETDCTPDVYHVIRAHSIVEPRVEKFGGFPLHGGNSPLRSRNGLRSKARAPELPDPFALWMGQGIGKGVVVKGAVRFRDLSPRESRLSLSSSVRHLQKAPHLPVASHFGSIQGPRGPDCAGPAKREVWQPRRVIAWCWS